MEGICRTCLRTTSNSAVNLSSELHLIDKIQAITSLELIINDELPQQICSECVKNVNLLYNFRRVIIHTDQDLRQRIECNSKLKEKQVIIKTQDTSDECEFNNSCDGNIDQDEEYNNYSDDQTSTETKTNHKTEKLKRIERTMPKKVAFLRCRTCNFTFSTRSEYQEHKRVEHCSRSVCSICGQSVRSDNMSKHLKLHWEGPVKCDECGKMLKNSESLRGHKMIHRASNYTCEICGRTFKVKSEHVRHLKQHADPDLRKSTCKLCGKKVCDLKRHVLSHTGEKPHLCTICGKGLTSTHALKIHMRYHTNEKPFKCSHCTSAFPQGISLKLHLISKHGVI